MEKLCALLLLLTTNSFALNQLTLHFIPSPKGINWRSPQSLAASTLKNEIAGLGYAQNHAIGHVYEEIECGDYHRFLGMTSSGTGQEARTVLLDGYGLGSILKKYKGKFDDTNDAQIDLSKIKSIGRSNYIRFKVSASTCDRIINYMNEYQARGYDQIYAGLDAHPLLGQGSGCSAFGASFLEISGLQIKEFENEWMRHYIVPYKYIGGPITGKRVSLFKVLFAYRSKWASSLQNGIAIDFFDPDLMHAWVKQAIHDVHHQEARTFDWPAEISMKKNDQGIIFDATQVATPVGPFFKVETDLAFKN